MKLVLNTKEIVENGFEEFEFEVLCELFHRTGYVINEKGEMPTHNQTETAQKPLEKEKTTQSKGKTKKEPESVPTQVEEPKEDTREITVDLGIVKGLAQNLAKTSPETKEKVKKVIGKYSTDTKLTGVSEKDYGNLYKDLQALN